MAAGRAVVDRVVPGPGLTRLAAIVGLALVLAGCAALTRWEPPDVHVVQRGDTLFQIAFKHRLDWRDVAAWNGLGNAHRIYPGQELRLSPPGGTRASGPAARSAPAPSRPASSPATTARRPAGTVASVPRGPAPAWDWPVRGPLLWRFGESRRNPTGIGIGGTDGAEVRAAADGEVVYSGSGLIGYGQLIFVQHSDTFLSAYGYNRTLKVSEGERVKSGQVIALMGRGPADVPLLHFEIRVEGKPANPVRFLPQH